jgi:hypothetical protein
MNANPRTKPLIEANNTKGSMPRDARMMHARII